MREGLVCPSHLPLPDLFRAISFQFLDASEQQFGDDTPGFVIRRAVIPSRELESWPNPGANQDALCPLERSTQVMLEAGGLRGSCGGREGRHHPEVLESPPEERGRLILKPYAGAGRDSASPVWFVLSREQLIQPSSPGNLAQSGCGQPLILRTLGPLFTRPSSARPTLGCYGL